MSDNWIKLRGSLMTHPKVSRIGTVLQQGARVAELCAMPRDVMRDVTVAALCRVWCATNEHTVDGTWHGVGVGHIDSIAGYEGFGAAMVSVGWLVVDVDILTLTLPNFLEWNAPAKGGKRSPGAARQAAYRARLAAAGDAKSDVTAVVTSDVTVTHRDRGRDRTKEPPNPRRRRGLGVRFPDFWLAWPQNERKQDKAKCLDHWKLHDLDTVADAILADVRSKRGTEKWRDGHIEAPLTYLRGRRWEDGQEPNAALGGGVVAWDRDGGTIRAEGIKLGLGDWNRDAAEHGEPGAESFAAYTARVREAVDALEPA